MKQAACVKGNVREYAESIIAAIEAKKPEIFDDLGRKTKSTLEKIGIKRDEVEAEFQLCELDIEKTKTLMKRWISAEIMQPNDNLDKIFKDESNQDDTADCLSQSSPRLYFMKNQKLFWNILVPLIILPLQVRLEKESVKRLLDLKQILL